MEFVCPRCLLKVGVNEESLPITCCNVRYESLSDIEDSNSKIGKVVIVKCEKCGLRRRTTEGSGSICERCYPLVPITAYRNELKDDCLFRADGYKRTVPCTSCNGNKTKIKVFGCAVHRECTIEPTSPQIKNCRQCRDYVSIEPNSRRARFVTNADLVKDTLSLLRKLPPNLAGVAGIPRSGMIPASTLATSLHLPLYTLTHKGLNQIGCGWRLSDTVHEHREGPMLIVDDTSMYGGALNMAKDFWSKFGGGREAIFSTVYSSPLKYHRHGPMPDVFAVELDDPHLLEWCFFNCGFARRTAFDFDGVLTIEGTDKPLYKPVKYPVELIVTGRLENHRDYSEGWLKRHGITVKKMVMWRGTLEERDESPEKIAEFKAEEFAKSGLRFFVESEPIQAAHIARLTKKLVICPAIAKVF